MDAAHTGPACIATDVTVPAAATHHRAQTLKVDVQPQATPPRIARGEQTARDEIPTAPASPTCDLDHDTMPGTVADRLAPDQAHRSTSSIAA
ncbi:hypothetical protein WR25_15857 [Diploscapter pachys]|jgi:hypothetical protein|uniref:Uncharacterized protein n=1 Tax=Diploscapter pachys TaxID=2018661 RepID=A0A2A2M246_9BILA|nr:hypothetical protein WR25_15857 [Diploscapter pachys]